MCVPCPDNVSAPRWTCLTWPGCGSRLRSEGSTPETQSPETCCGSTTPFSSNTQVTHSGPTDVTVLHRMPTLQTVSALCVCEADGESRLGFNEVPKLEEVGVASSRRRRDYRDPYQQFSSQRTTAQDGQSSFISDFFVTEQCFVSLILSCDHSWFMLIGNVDAEEEYVLYDELMKFNPTICLCVHA